jgi:hypothetical protein
MSTFCGVVDAILEVGRQRKEILSQMKAALQSGQEKVVVDLARQLCGLNDEKSDRANTRLN